MEFDDDEDPAWLEACMAAVDSLPVANLRNTPTTYSANGNKSTSDTSLHRSINSNNGRSSSCSSNSCSTPALPRDRAGGERTSSTHSSSLPSFSPAIRGAGSASANAVSHRASPSSPPSRGSVGPRPGPYGSSSRTAGHPSRGSWTKGTGGRRRVRGVGANVSGVLLLYCLVCRLGRGTIRCMLEDVVEVYSTTELRMIDLRHASSHTADAVRTAIMLLYDVRVALVELHSFFCMGCVCVELNDSGLALSQGVHLSSPCVRLVSMQIPR